LNQYVLLFLFLCVVFKTLTFILQIHFPAQFMQYIFTNILIFIKNILYNILFQSLNATLTFISIWLILKAIFHSLMFLQLYTYSLIMIMLYNPLQLISILAYHTFIFSFIELFTFSVYILKLTKTILQDIVIIAFRAGTHIFNYFTP